jgi:hypothetical protein
MELDFGAIVWGKGGFSLPKSGPGPHWHIIPLFQKSSLPLLYFTQERLEYRES